MLVVVVEECAESASYIDHVHDHEHVHARTPIRLMQSVDRAYNIQSCMYTRRLLAIDPSLTCSGWAMFSIQTGTLSAVGKIRSLAPSYPLAQRLRDLQSKIDNIFHKLKIITNDVLVCEAPTTMRDPRAAFKVEQVRGIFEALARSSGLIVPGRINPRSVHHEIMGLRGKQLAREQVKETAVHVVHALYQKPLSGMGFDTTKAALTRHQDIIDAILVGNLALTWINAATLAGIDLEEYFESRKAVRRRPTLRDFGRRGK